MFSKLVYYIIVYFGDWGLGIGDWAQSPIPNPHPHKYDCILKYYLIKNILL